MYTVFVSYGALDAPSFGEVSQYLRQVHVILSTEPQAGFLAESDAHQTKVISLLSAAQWHIPSVRSLEAKMAATAPTMSQACLSVEPNTGHNA